MEILLNNNVSAAMEIKPDLGQSYPSILVRLSRPEIQERDPRDTDRAESGSRSQQKIQSGH